MFKVFVTEVVISKGYEGASAIRFSEKGDAVRFRIGQKVYDTREENNTRWINVSVKAFGALCERIKKMNLKEGSFINLSGRYDEESWIDETTKKKRSCPVIILEDIEYCLTGGKKQEMNQSTQNTSPTAPTTKDSVVGENANPMESNNFTGFEAYDGQNFFDV